jgi:Uma2 family endonuclease
MELQLDLNKRYTYADYLTWLDDKRRELIDGFVKLMSPAPSTSHQQIEIRIASDIRVYLKKKKCKVFVSPFDVRLPSNGEKEGDKIFTVVQPDICIICDLSKLDEKGCLGAPDMIIEITSNSNTKHDVETKFQLYQKNRVREYWIVFPYEKTIIVNLLNKSGKYEFVVCMQKIQRFR